eukprot:TRINITY_DN7346_c0_g1_i1.p1 TRINITY_DN7346_c0_g1~~TRINITY_DN7346_c0_g1_i1.p1  ORF type:complete len:100 (-),score=12.73 TRINITY_DN7346_c0_g1_i1:639-938(-)
MAKTRGFLSDLATCLVGSSALVELASSSGKRTLTAEEFLGEGPDMRNELLVAITVPFSSAPTAKCSSYKVGLRPQNCHAYINATFYVELPEGKFGDWQG